MTGPQLATGLDILRQKQSDFENITEVTEHMFSHPVSMDIDLDTALESSLTPSELSSIGA